ncbi:MAG: hypothetical protein AB8D52_03800 [Gammaproteobacteria bacterium]
MKHKIEWSMLQSSILTFLVCLILSGALLAGSFLFRDKMKTEHNQYQSHFRDVSQKYLSVDGDEKIIKEHYPRFIEYYNRGIIGSEKRLNWIETLQSTGEGIKLPAMRYQIESRKPYKPDYELNTGSYELYATRMKLNLGLLHEIDLAKLISELNKDASGLFNIKRCRFSRTNKNIQIDPEKSNISADCELQWYSLNLTDEEIKL